MRLKLTFPIMKNIQIASACIFLLSAISVKASVTVQLDESFEVPAGDLNEVLSAYLDWSFYGTSDVKISDGKLEMAPQGVAQFQRFALTTPLTGDTKITVISSRSPTLGYGAGLLIGSKNLIFQPSSADGSRIGIFRLEQYNGGPEVTFSLANNEPLGYVTAPDSPYILEARVNADTGLVNVSLSEQSNPSNLFTTSYIDTSLSSQYSVALTVHGFDAAGSVFFHSVKVETSETVSADSDEDSVYDAEDNCPADPNPDQRDLDADGVGDVCDNCFLANSDQLDENANDIGDICDALDDFVGGGPVQDTINALTDRVDALEAGQAAQDQTIADQQSQIDSLQTTVGNIENLPTIKKLLEKVQELEAVSP